MKIGWQLVEIVCYFLIMWNIPDLIAKNIEDKADAIAIFGCIMYLYWPLERWLFDKIQGEDSE